MSQNITRTLIISDTHAHDDVIIKVLKEVGSFDILVHAGDLEGSDLLYEEIAAVLPGVSYYSVAGNNDFFTDAPSVREFDLPGTSPLHVFLAHGHQYHIDSGYREICAEARRRSAQILICGHTHVPTAVYSREAEANVKKLSPYCLHHPFGRLKRKRPSDSGPEDLLVLNPGSLSYPRQENKQPSYILLETAENTVLQYRICYLS